MILFGGTADDVDDDEDDDDDDISGAIGAVDAEENTAEYGGGTDESGTVEVCGALAIPYDDVVVVVVVVVVVTGANCCDCCCDSDSDCDGIECGAADCVAVAETDVISDAVTKLKSSIVLQASRRFPRCCCCLRLRRRDELLLEMSCCWR